MKTPTTATPLEHLAAQLKAGRLELGRYEVRGPEITLRFRPPRRRKVTPGQGNKVK